LSDGQLRTMRRVGRPPIGSQARQLIALRLDPEVLSRFRAEAKRLKIGDQTLRRAASPAWVDCSRIGRVKEQPRRRATCAS